MKVLFVSGVYPTQTLIESIFTHNQAKALQRQGIDVRVLEIDMRSIRRIRKWGYKKDSYDGITVYRMAVPCGPIPVLLDALSPMAANHAITKVIRDWGKPDMLHAHFSDGCGVAAASMRSKHSIPLVLTEHSAAVLEENLTDRSRKLFNICAVEAERIIAVSAALHSSMCRLTSKPVITVPNIILNSFTNVDIKKDKRFTFISIGHLVESKRFDLTIRAFAKLQQQSPDVRLLIVGQGTLKLSLKKLAVELGVSDSVEFLGCLPNNQLPELYSRCHCFVLPSMFETFGVVYAEAIACGIPVIATRCGGPEDIVNENNGVLITRDNEDELHDAMKLMLERAGTYNPQLMSEDIRNRFGEDAVASRLIEIYKQVLSAQ